MLVAAKLSGGGNSDRLRTMVYALESSLRFVYLVGNVWRHVLQWLEGILHRVVLAAS